MMKLLLSLGMLLLSMTVTASPAEPLDMATRLPPVDVFASIRTDAGSIAALDAVLLRVSDELPDSITSPLTVSDLISGLLGLGDLNLDVTNLLTRVIGDYAAVGVDLLDALDDGVITEDDALVVYVVTPVENRNLLEITLQVTGLLQDAAVSQEDGYTVYALAERPVVLALSESEMRITIGAAEAALEPARALADDEDFAPTMNALPATDYLAWFYANTGGVVRALRPDPAVQEILAALGFQVETLGTTAAGLQLNGVETLVMDVVQERRAAMPPPQPLPDPAFVGYVPDDVDLFVHTTDINQLIGTMSGLIASISGSTTSADIYMQIENIIRLLLDLNLQTDILPWASGNYGVVASLPDDPVENVAALNIGALLEVTDVSAASELVVLLAETVERLADDTTVTPTRIVDAATGNSVEAFLIQLEETALGRFEIAIGVYEQILFVATYPLAVELLGDTPSLRETPVYQAARAGMLPGAQLTAFIADRAPGNVIRLLFEVLEPLEVILGAENANTILEVTPDFFVDVVTSSGISALVDRENNLVFRLNINLEP